MKGALKGSCAAAVAALSLGSFVSFAISAELPKSLAWTAYDVGSSGYSQAVAIGSALKNEKGVTLRILPGKNDVSRMVPLRDGKVQFSATGIGAMQAYEGVEVFASAVRAATGISTGPADPPFGVGVVDELLG